MRFFNRFIKKLNSKFRTEKGESIAEVLVALLISSVGLVMLAAMISSSVKMLQQSKTGLFDYVEAENSIVEQSGGESGSIIIKSGDAKISLTDTSGDPIQVHYFVETVNSTHNIVSYRAD